jgi:hypothetical protein
MGRMTSAIRFLEHSEESTDETRYNQRQVVLVEDIYDYGDIRLEGKHVYAVLCFR